MIGNQRKTIPFVNIMSSRLEAEYANILTNTNQMLAFGWDDNKIHINFMWDQVL